MIDLAHFDSHMLNRAQIPPELGIWPSHLALLARLELFVKPIFDPHSIAYAHKTDAPASDQVAHTVRQRLFLYPAHRNSEGKSHNAGQSCVHNSKCKV